MTPEEIEPRVSSILKLLQTQIDDSYFCPRHGFDLDRTLLMLVSRAIRVALAVCHLVAGDFYGEAFGLTRSVLEAYFIVKYISSKDSEARANSYLEFELAHLYNREEIRKKYFPEIERSEGITELLNKAKHLPSTHHWVPAHNMATEYYDHPLEIDSKTGKGFKADHDYEISYEITSHYVHTTVLSMKPHTATWGDFFKTAKRDNEEDRGLLALHYSLGYVCMVCIMLGRQWRAELPREVNDTITSLLHDLRVAVSERSGIVWRTGPVR